MDLHSLQDAFSGLCVDDNLRQDLASPAASLHEDDSNRPSLLEIYQASPVNAFDRPIYYRTIHRESSAVCEGSLVARLFPPPLFDELTVEDLRLYARNHARATYKQPTPFLSMTDDLLRAINIALCKFADKEDVETILIDAWQLAAGSFLRCNDFREKILIGRYPIYNTEILAWGKIPSCAIICSWKRSRIAESGLFDVLPSLRSVSHNTTLSSLREGLRGDLDSYIPAKVAIALTNLGMNPSSMVTKQVFLFLLGAVHGYRVEKSLLEISNILEVEHSRMILEFDQATHQISVQLSRSRMVEFYRNEFAAKVERCTPPEGVSGRVWRKQLSYFYNRHFRLDFESWWVEREKDHHLDEAEFSYSPSTGLVRWLAVNRDKCRRIKVVFGD